MSANKVPTWTPSAARLALSVGLVLAVWVLATCGAPARAPAGQPPDAGLLIEYRRTGGIAGVSDHLVIQSDGQATLQQKGGEPQTLALDERTLSELQQTLNDTPFADLNSRYEPGRDIPDAFHYTITYVDNNRRYTVELSDGAVPQELAPVLNQLNQILVGR